MLTGYNFLDLFSGIGGFAIAMQRAGVPIARHFYSEVNDFADRVYHRRFPEAVNVGDIGDFNPASLVEQLRAAGDPQRPWIVTGGFPCQDISIAGVLNGRPGLDGDRSGLWFEMWRVARALRPVVLFPENVGELTNKGLSTVLGCLAEIGYDAEWQDLRATDVGGLHRRERIWILAYPSVGDTDRSGSQRHRQSNERSGECSARSPGAQLEFARNIFADRRAANAWNTESCVPAVGFNGVARIVESGIPPLAHGVCDRVERIKTTGNAIVPDIAELVLRLCINAGLICVPHAAAI